MRSIHNGASDAPIVLCVGLPRSGSTWALNATIACLRLEKSPGSVQTIYADSVTDAVVERGTGVDVLVIKSHMPTPSLRLMLELGWAPCIVTVRSPHDCVLSLMERFHFSFHDALMAIRQASICIVSLMKTGKCLVLRYEENFTRSPDTVRKIAAFLGHTPHDNFSTDVVNRLSPSQLNQRFDDLIRDGVFQGKSARDEIEPETQWHFNHLGDGKVGGSSSRLDHTQLLLIDHALRATLQDMGYSPLRPPEPISLGAKLNFDFFGLGAAYLDSGFDQVEEWGTWIVAPTANLVIPLIHPIETDVALLLVIRLSPVFTTTTTAACAIIVNGRRVIAIQALNGTGEYLNLSIRIPAENTKLDTINIRFESKNVKSPAEIGINSDTRALAIGLISCELLPSSH